jgi:hypothetical protein
VYDFDTNKPIQNVEVKSNQSLTLTDSLGNFSLQINYKSDYNLNLKKEGYADKKVNRKPDSSEKDSDKRAKKNIIYMFKRDSDFLNKNK